jgi:site-specific DNA-methyltransferase (adenine-specific)
MISNYTDKHETERSRVYQMDCIEAMKQYPDKYFDLAVVDPPYGIGANKMQLGNGRNKIYRGQADWDKAIPTAEYWGQLFRVSKNQIVWGGNYMTEYLKPTGAWLFWDKGTGENDFADGELAWTSYNGALRKINKSWVGANAKDGLQRIHPTQKPKMLYDWIFKKYANYTDKILDTHLGSGSSRIAADKAGLDFTGFELDSEYFTSSVKWFNEYKLQLKLL